MGSGYGSRKLSESRWNENHLEYQSNSLIIVKNPNALKTEPECHSAKETVTYSLT